MVGLAYADVHPSELSTLRVVMYCAMWMGLFAVLAAVPIMTARRRGHRHAEAIMALALVCALVAGGSACMTVSALDKWAREDELLLDTGYYSPQEQHHERPAMPWGLWIGVGVAYCAIVGWSVAGRGRAGDGGVRANGGE